MLPRSVYTRITRAAASEGQPSFTRPGRANAPVPTCVLPAPFHDRTLVNARKLMLVHKTSSPNHRHKFRAASLLFDASLDTLDHSQNRGAA